MAQIPMTLSAAEGHFKFVVTTDKARRAIPLRLHSF